MARKKNPVLRILIPLLGLALAVLVAYGFYKNAGKSASQNNPPASPSAVADPAKPATGTAIAPAPAGGTSGAPSTSVTPVAPPVGTVAAELSNLHVQSLADDLASANFTSVGSLDEKSKTPFEITFNHLGAGIELMRSATYFETVRRSDHVTLQHTNRVPRIDSVGRPSPDFDAVVPFATLAVELNGATIPLASSTGDRFWRQAAPGKFEAFIVNGDNQRVARIEKQYLITDGKLSIELRHTLVNLTKLPMTIRFIQMGPTELDADLSYRMDARRLRYGYLLSRERDPGQATVVADDFRFDRASALGSRIDGPPGAAALYNLEPVLNKEKEIGWPNSVSVKEGHQLSWIAMTNRYFGVAVHPLFDPASKSPVRTLDQIEHVDRLVVDRGSAFEKLDTAPIRPVLSVRMISRACAAAPGAAAEFSYAIFAGPTSRKDLQADPVTAGVGLDRMIFFKQVSFCAPCSFEMIGDMIYGLIRLLHDMIFHDWSLAIIFMVFVVRTVLHPVTRWSQVRMLRFGKQMQGMQPKIAKLQERFKDDKAALQRETARLWSEEGVSPLGMVGCIPMFLVMPVWMGIWAVIFAAFEFRHQPAFYGLFQSLTGGQWLFLADLAEPDHLIAFKEPITVPVLSSLMGPIGGINILPLILGGVFYLHQKYLTPPTATVMTPEQEMQTKMMKVMSVVMFPVMMYNSPCGLALYFIANSTIAIFENQWIRRSAEKSGQLNPENFKNKGGGGLIGKIMAAAEERRQQMENPKDPRKRGR